MSTADFNEADRIFLQSQYIILVPFLTMEKTVVQKLAFGYAVIFFLVVALNAIPQIHDDAGLMFGLFKLDLIDDILHLASALWALIAGWRSAKAATVYFTWFGAAYFLDGLVGIIFGRGFLDLAIFLDGPLAIDLLTKIALNIPHIVLGGSAVLIGWWFGRKKT